MSKKWMRVRNTLMTKMLTVLGFSSPLALMACYGTPTTGYGTKAYIEETILNGNKGDSVELSIVADGHWDVVSVPDFAVLSQDSGTGTSFITVKAIEDNLTNDYRDGVITIQDETGEQSITISQMRVVAEQVAQTDAGAE